MNDRPTDYELDVLRKLAERPERVPGDPNDPGIINGYASAKFRNLMRRGWVESVPLPANILEHGGGYVKYIPMRAYQLTNAGRELLAKLQIGD